MEYAAGVKKAQYNKVKLENRKMLIKPSYLITAVGIASVSYTHLDVYKRQMLISWLLFLWETVPLWMRPIWAVSYTHLGQREK